MFQSKIFLELFCFFYFLINILHAQQTNYSFTIGNYVSTIAGTGLTAYNGDNQLAVYANINSPCGISFLNNNSGDIIFSDTNNNRIRKIYSNGTIVTIAGTGTNGYNGDNMLATLAQLHSPRGLSVNSLGEIFIADTGNHRIRKILTNGTIITIAGTGSTSYNSDNVLATSANLYSPSDVVVVGQSGDVLFITDDNNRIRKVNVSTGIITTIAGSGDCNFNGDGILAILANICFPSGIDVDQLGQIYIADYYNGRIRKVFTNGTITTIAGTATRGYNGDNILAVNADLFSPRDVVVNQLTGEVYIADSVNYRVRKILSNGTITTILGTGSQGFNGDGILATTAMIDYPQALAISQSGQVLITDTSNHRIRTLVPCPTYSTQVGSVCYCSTGYYGQNCNQFNCSGLISDSSDVCSSNGVCVSPNNCSCNTFYSGVNCQEFTCFGVLNSQPNVCSGFGKCISYDTCSCNSGYSNSSCNIFKCNNIISTDTTVCSSKGSCQAPNNCSCQTGFSGEICDSYSCYGVLKDSKSVCSGIGDCKGPDICYCPTSTDGVSYNKDCSISKVTNGTTSTDQTTVIVAVVVPIAFIVISIIVILLIIIIVLIYRNRVRDSKTMQVDLLNRSFEMKPLNSISASDFPSQYSSSSKLSHTADAMDRYTNYVKIGEGGFGKVFKVTDVKCKNETKAIKIIRFENTEDLNNAMREGIQLLKMNHPNILKINDFFVGNGQILCIDMVYYEKGDLNVFISGSRFCSEKMVGQILNQSCSVLDYIYKNFGVIHRDIKPSNIFIQNMDNSSIDIVIADFGLAKNTKQSSSFSFAGTPLFISPELLCGVSCDRKTDIFSLGVTLYQIISHDSVTSINQMYMLKDSDSVREILKEKINYQTYSKELVDLILNMLEKDPEKRPDADSILKHQYFSH